MKRVFIIILSFLYMASVSGATVHMHYCMGKFMSASFTHEEEKVCGKCGMKKSAQKKGCCKDEHKTFKTTDHQLAKATFDFKATSAPVFFITRFHAYLKPLYNNRVTCSTKAHSPPSLWRPCPIYIEVHNFRI